MSYPSPASTDELVSKVLVDFKTHDYRGFIFVVHATYGLMLLRCTRKKNKPLHWQLPGGHVDEPEFNKAAEENSDRKTQLSAAGKMGAARELFEETGIDVRKELDRLQPANLRTKTKAKKGVELLQNEYKYRLFYFLSVTDTDFPSKGETPFGTDGKHLKLKLSIEHSGFIFQPEPPQAAEMLKLHSGGRVSEALLMAMEGKPEADDSASSDIATPIAEIKSSPARSPYAIPSRSLSADRGVGDEPIDLLPPPPKKNIFCCFGR